MPVTTCLVADVGGTKTRLALLRQPGDAPADTVVMRNDEHDGLRTLTQAYLAEVRPGIPPTAAAYCVACPVEGDSFTLTNRDWTISISQLRDELGLARLEVVNDFTAIAMSVPYLTGSDVEQVGGEFSLVGGFQSGTTAIAPSEVCGDQNNDFRVDADDVFLDLSFIVGIFMPQPFQSILSDLDQD